MRLSFKLVLISAFLLYSAGRLCAQSLPDSTVQKVNNLFSQWNKANSPGCAVGVVRNDSLIYFKGFGMADLEHGMPIGPATVFNMGSVSKQFTAYSIVLLAGQGKVNLDEDIHTYLAWMPDFRKKITVRNLLNHTSGIRDYLNLALLTGMNASGTIAQQYAVNIIKRQRTLMFQPGDRYSYSNSNFILLAEIVKAVSGRSLKQFADSAIFRPLGMLHSGFVDNRADIIANRAMSYERIDSNHYVNDYPSVASNGDGGLFTTVSDMSKWLANFYTPTAGSSSHIAQLVQRGKLNNGSTIDYALGITVQFLNGGMFYEHNGGLNGYRTDVSVYPDNKMALIIFSNLGEVNTGDLLDAMQDIFIKNRGKSPQPPILADTNLAVVRDTAMYRKYMGDYIAEDGAKFYFFMKNAKIYTIPPDLHRYLLIRSVNDTFYERSHPEIKFVFKKTSSGSTVEQVRQDFHRLMEWYDIHAPLSDAEVHNWAGTYYSSELDCRYRIEARDNTLILINPQFDEFPLIPTGRDHFFSRRWWINDCKIVRNSKGDIIGFDINDERSRNLRFSKLD